MQPDELPQPLDLRRLLSVLRRRRVSIALVTVSITLLAIGLVAWRAPVYTSVAQVEVRPLTIDEQFQAAPDAAVNMDTEATRVTQEPVAKLAAAPLGLDPESPGDLADAARSVEVTVQSNTTFLQISCTQDGPSRAQRCASSFAAAYVQDRVDNVKALYDERIATERARIQQANDQVERLSERLDQLDGDQDAARAAIRAQIDAQSGLIVAANTSMLSLPTASPDAAVLARSAELPTGPSNKNFLPTGILAATLGLTLGIGLALLRERLADPIAGTGDLEQLLEAPVLAAVPAVSVRGSGSPPTLVTTHSPESPASQAYRGAGASLLHLAGERTLKVVAVTGPGEREGKTAATGNLAVVLAQRGKRVVAVSCDLRNPTLHRFLRGSNDVGLTDVLRGEAALTNALQPTDEPGLVLLASGPVPRNPTELLGTKEARSLFAELRTRFDFVLLDGGPGLVADILFLVRDADGIVVVADAAKTSRTGIANLRDQMKSVGGRIVGGILYNRAPERADRASSAYHAAIATNHDRAGHDPSEAASSDLPEPKPDGGADPAPPPTTPTPPRVSTGARQSAEPKP